MRPDSIMFIYGIDNNILNCGTRILSVNQEIYKILDLYQKMISFWVRTKQEKLMKLRCKFIHSFFFFNRSLHF